MKKKKILSVLLVMLVAFLVYQPIKASAQWKQTQGKNWYYLNEKGKKLKSRWVGDYYLNSKGFMVKNKWISGKKGRRYFVGEDGKWIPKFNGGWQKIQGKWYYYSGTGKKQTGFVTVEKSRYYLNKDGIMLTGLRKIDGKRYFFNSKGKMLFGFRTIKSNTYYFTRSGKKGYALTGLQTLSQKRYYFNSSGVMQKGWKKIGQSNYYFEPASGAADTGWASIGGVKYYFNDAGVMLTGQQTIGGSLYYFQSNGVMAKNTTITIGGKAYTVDGNGVCTPKTEVGGRPSEEMLFFTFYESGLASYGQTGGDNGHACGRYQFDYRYSLLPLVKYCYAKEPVIFREFKTYASYSTGARLDGNRRFFKAWTTVYNRAPEVFSAYQDIIAKEEYYNSVEASLLNYNINIRFRRDVIKGAVFSYSIQHGPGAALEAVRRSGIKSGTSDELFIKKLYNYRINSFPLYKSRYTQEKSAALRYLS